MAKTKYVINSKRWPGVYGYDSDQKRYRGKPDVCYYINYRIDNKLKWEKIGWKSEGYSPAFASEKRGEKIKLKRHGDSVKTDKEIRQEKNKIDGTFEEIKQAYFASDRGKSLKGRKTDLNRYDLYLRSLFGGKQVSNFSQLDIEKLKFRMKDLAPATIYNALELLRRLINYGVKYNLCRPLSFTIDFPSINNEITEYLTQEETSRLFDTLDSWPNQDVSRMLKVAMFTGMRRGEIFKLLIGDIDFHHNILWLRNPKGGRDESVPMSETIKIIFEEQLAWCKENHPNSLYAFPAYHGGPRTKSSAAYRIKKKANLPKKFRIFHGLRHNLGVTLANSGEYTLDMIGELLTHKSTAVTKRYAQFLPETKRKAADRAVDILQASIFKTIPEK